MATLTFEAIYQGHPVEAYLEPRSILVYQDEEGEFMGSIRIYFNPDELPVRPNALQDLFALEGSVNQFISDTFGVDPDVSYSERGRQGEDYVDFDLNNAGPFYNLASNPNYRAYITFNPSEYWG